MRFLKTVMTGRAGFGWMFSLLITVSVLGSIVAPTSGNKTDTIIMCGLLLGYGLFFLAGCYTAYNLAQKRDSLFTVLGLLAGLAFLLIGAATQLASFLLPQNPALFLPEDRVSGVSLTNGEIRISGPIDYQMLTDLRAVLESDPSSARVILESVGGNVIAGRSIGLLIESHGLNVHVEKECFSACTLAFAGGTVRTLAQNASLGFHGYAFDHGQRVQTLEVDSIEMKDRDYLLSRGFESGFVDRIFDTPPDELWKPDITTLLQAGVITGY